MKEVVLSFLHEGGTYDICGATIKSGKWFLDTYSYLNDLFGDVGACALVVDKNSPEDSERTNFDVFLFPLADKVYFCEDDKDFWPCCSHDRYVIISSRKLKVPHVEYVHDKLNDAVGAYDTKDEYDSSFTIAGYWKGLKISAACGESYFNRGPGGPRGAYPYRLSFDRLEEAIFEKLTSIIPQLC